VATNGSGGPSVRDLSSTDLELTADDGRSVAVKSVAQAAPPKILALLDISVSVIPASATPLVLDILDRGLFRRLQQTDRVRFGAISRVLTLGDSFSSDRAVLFRQARSVASNDNKLRYGPSPLWDVLDDAVTLLEKEGGRRAIVLFSDGEATGNVKSRQSVIDHASRADVSVSVIGALVRQIGARRQLQSVAEQTGGRYVDGPRPGDLRPIRDLATDGLASILDDLHHAHVVEIDLPAGVSTISVRSRSSKVFVAFRQLTFGSTSPR
jgi:hypothetical protein